MENQQLDELIQQISEQLGDSREFSEAGYFEKLSIIEKLETFQRLPFQDQVKVRWRLVLQPSFRRSFTTTWGRVQWGIFLLFFVPSAVVAILQLFESEEPRSSGGINSATSSGSMQSRARTTQPPEVIELEMNERNCARIDGVLDSDFQKIARRYNVSVSTVRFLGAGYGWETSTGARGCVVTFDTGAGPKKCEVIRIYGRSDVDFALTTVDPYSIGSAPLCESP